MTRINTIDVKRLSKKHLQAEFFELPRLRKNVLRWKAKGCPDVVPSSYRMGEGHVKFFYDKPIYVHNRFMELAGELVRRGVNIDIDKMYETADSISDAYSGIAPESWLPLQADVNVNLQRLIEKDPEHYS